MKKVFLFIVLSLAVLLVGCSAESNNGPTKHSDTGYNAFKTKILDYEIVSNGEHTLITVVVDHKLYALDTDFDNIRFENSIQNIKGSYLYGKVKDGEFKNLQVKSK